MTTETTKSMPKRGTGTTLRIGMVAPPWFEVPPRGYGGTESVVASLVDGLAALGHEVTLIASGQQHTQAVRQIGAYATPPTALLGSSVMPELIQAAEAARVLAAFDLDVVHDHTVAGPLLARGRAIPTLATMHGPVDGENLAYFERLGRTVDLVAISDAQRFAVPALNWVGTVHNAIDVPSFPYVEDKGDELLWIGRFSPDKGAHHAIDAARAVGRRIVLAGKLNEKPESEFFESHIRPRLGPDVEYVGEADATVKRELFARAACLLFPITWEEPFGMVMVEAMACGTPVVATRRGSVPEVVDDGRTGVIVDRLDQIPAAIERAVALRPKDCRAHVEARFDLPVMAAGYERIYRVLVEGSASIRELTAPTPRPGPVAEPTTSPGT